MAPSECTPNNNNSKHITAMPTSPTTPDGETTSVVKKMSKVKAELDNEANDADLHRNSDCESLSQHESEIDDDIEEEDCSDNVSENIAVEEKSKAMEFSQASPASVSSVSSTDQAEADTDTAVPEAEEATSEEQLVLKNVRVRIQKRPTVSATIPSALPDYEVLILPELRLPLPATLDGVRCALTNSVLGDSSRDIFFPSWTKSLYITWNETGELETIESNEALTKALEKIEGLTLLLQECRNARYSRRKYNNNQYNAKHMNMNIGGGTRSPFFYPIHNHISNRVDRPIYFDNPTHYYLNVHPAALAAAYGCVMPQGHGQQGRQQYPTGNNAEGMAYMPTPFVVPFMYAPPQH